MSAKRLIVNADDFGLTAGVNAGIVEAFERGILRSTTLMANGPAFDDAARLARQTPGLDVGCHLVLIGGRPLTEPASRFPDSATELLRRLFGRYSVEWIEREFIAQIGKIVSAGIDPTHLDSHKHTHLAPPVLEAVLRVASRFGIRWIRRPFDLPLTAARNGGSWKAKIVARAVRPLANRFERKLRTARLHSTGAFAGFQMTGRFRSAQLAALIHALPEGLTEFMCHPGRCDGELRAMPTRLTDSRQEELAALTSGEVLQAIREAGVEVTSFAAESARIAERHTRERAPAVK
jgi:predicted glycoside hydrolase/deacetylase ChbG (UPF0249 family)